MATPKFPMVFGKGRWTVKIYHNQNRKTSDSYVVAYYDRRVRKRTVFADLAQAKEEAKSQMARLKTHEPENFDLTAADVCAFRRAKELAAQVGMNVETAMARYVELVNELGDVPVMEAVRLYLKWAPTRQKVPVAEVVSEFLRSKEGMGLSAIYRDGLKWTLERFSRQFRRNILDVTPADVEAWMQSLDVGARSWNQIRSCVVALFRFAMTRRYVYGKWNPMDDLLIRKEPPRDIEVFKPAEMIEILGHASEHMIAFLALGAFAGIRHAEIQRMTWKDVEMEAGLVILSAAKTKTASRRIVPIQPNLREWLSPASRESGPVCEASRINGELARLVERINETRQERWERERREAAPGGEEAPERTDETPFQPFRWIHNGLRHSYVSYRIAETQDVNKVALEAGTSPQIIFRCYRELVRGNAAKQWFDITPATVEQAKQTKDASPEGSQESTLEAKRV